MAHRPSARGGSRRRRRIRTAGPATGSGAGRARRHRFLDRGHRRDAGAPADRLVRPRRLGVVGARRGSADRPAVARAGPRTRWKPTRRSGRRSGGSMRSATSIPSRPRRSSIDTDPRGARHARRRVGRARGPGCWSPRSSIRRSFPSTPWPWSVSPRVTCHASAVTTSCSPMRCARPQGCRSPTT